MSATPAGHLEMLRRITEQIAGVREPEDVTAVLQAIARGLVDHAGVAAAQIWLYHADRECPHCAGSGAGDERALHSRAYAGDVHPDHMRSHHRLPLGWNLPGVVAELRAPVHIEDAQGLIDAYLRDPESSPLGRQGRSWDSDIAWVRASGFQSAVAYPLVAGGDDVVGVFTAHAHRLIDAAEFAHLAVFAQQAAICVHGALLLQEADRLRRRLTEENAYLREEIRVEGGFAGIVGESRALRSVQSDIANVAPTGSTVLILGETGTGKELIARAIHALSARASRPLIKVNCGAISPGLIESELFGHERGAFTGAAKRRIGRFELADGGTLFLDEVGELPPDAQVKLLRVLQEQEFERVGGDRTIRVDARVIAATNRNLEEEVHAGRFRADLFYRINVFPVTVPPLRDRPGDVTLLARHFVEVHGRRLGKPLSGISEASVERLRSYPWPGNIRELQNVIERACVLARGPVVDITDVLIGSKASADPGDDVVLTMHEMERRHIRRALEASRGRIEGPGGAAMLLGLHPNTLRSRMQRLNVPRAS